MTDYHQVMLWDMTNAICCFISFITVWSLIIAILRNPKVRSNTFNLYLVFCLVPDAVYFLLMLVVKVLYAVNDANYTSGGGDVASTWVLFPIEDWSGIYWVFSSLWMAFIVFVQIYRLLKANKQTKRYQPPTRKRVIIDSTIVHVVSVVFAAACTAVYELAWYWPYPAHDLALWIPFIPALGIPTLLITGMGFGVWWNKLLPPRNARYRSLSLFFARLLASTYLMAIGSVLKLLKMYYPIYSDKTFNTVMHVFGIFFLLGAFQVCLALTKKDVRNAFVDMWCCRKHDNGVLPSTTTGATRSTVQESNYHNDNNDDEVGPHTFDDAASTVVNEDIRLNENEGNEQIESSALQAGENSSRIIEAKHDLVTEG
jgi:F0F1-type ATP synthase membrane subunit c/vacuolar-type H+-ATPase subunit K